MSVDPSLSCPGSRTTRGRWGTRSVWCAAVATAARRSERVRGSAYPTDGRDRPVVDQDFGPTCTSSAATASRRATDSVFGRGMRHATPSRSSAAWHRPMMSADSLLKK